MYNREPYRAFSTSERVVRPAFVMAPNKKCLALPSVVQLCAILLVLCKALSAAPAKDEGEKFLDLWRENNCPFPTERVMTQVQTLCRKVKLGYVTGSQTWQFINAVCNTIFNISSNICRVSKETLGKHNLTEDKLINYMDDDTVKVCGEVAGTAVTKIWAELEFVVDDNSPCEFVFDDLDASNLLRLLYRLAWARHTLPPSPDVVWKNGFTTFRKSWDGLNCTFPPPWAMETDVNHTCYNPPRDMPKSDPWEYQEKLCAAFFHVTKSACTRLEIGSGHELKGLLDNEQFNVCDEAKKLKDVVPDMASELSVFTVSPNMCTYLCMDDKHVTRMCKLLYFAMTVTRFQHLQHVMQRMLGGPNPTTYAAPADGGHSTTHAAPADGGHSTTHGAAPDDGGHFTTHVAPDGGGHSTTHAAPADGGHSTTHAAPDDGGHSTTHAAPDDGGHSTTHAAPADGGHSTTHAAPDDGGHSTTHAAPDDGGTSSGDTHPKEEVPNTNPVEKTMAESLQSGSSVLFMVYIVTAICSVLLLYVVYYNRRRIIDCVLGRRESWQRHRDAEADGKYSPLEPAVEDFLSLDKAATKSKTHVY